eukprot:TRINITY_DN4080_c0_g1_i1.p1 TRINITY_DN4080_c0_g1~~TRINITY_DN4080_c0_g1_i1.p1  ORF type:complete len:202 (+),score=87.30 TRINITY_DN4080_c0_g1_i1:45-608(+)
MRIVGVTGTLGAGKGTVVEHLLKQRGFAYFSVRDYLTEEIKRRGLPVDRDSMTMVANDLRAQNSPSFIVEQLHARAVAAQRDCIIESIRTVGEVEALRRLGSFCLIAVEADAALRYDRIVVRGSATDKVSFETFLANEEREMANTDPNKQNISACIAMADIHLTNNGTPEEFHAQLDAAMAKAEAAQ